MEKNSRGLLRKSRKRVTSKRFCYETDGSINSDVMLFG